MKQLFFSAIALLITICAFAQAPQLMNYQAVARNTAGQALANQTIKVRLSANENGTTTFYTETRNVTTNALGLFNVQIGATGVLSSSGSLNATNWLDATKTRNLKVELDPNNSGTFIDMGNQQLVSVPYALAAGTAQTAKKLDKPFIGFRTTPAIGPTNLSWTTGSTYDVKMDNEVYDSSNVYNPATGEFTAPESGMYYLHASLYLHSYSTTNFFTGSIRFVSNLNGNIEPTSGGGQIIELPTADGQLINYNITTFLSQGEKIKCNLSKAGINTHNIEIYRNYGSFIEAYKIN